MKPLGETISLACGYPVFGLGFTRGCAATSGDRPKGLEDAGKEKGAFELATAGGSSVGTATTPGPVTVGVDLMGCR